MDIDIGNDRPFILIAGPCQIESKDHAYKMASSIKAITDKLGIQFIYKSSFDVKLGQIVLHESISASINCTATNNFIA